MIIAQANKGTVAGNTTGRIKTRTRAMFNPTALGLAYYILQPQPKGEQYISSITSGASLEPRSPALAVRNFFTAQNPKEVVALATILRGYRRLTEGLDWTRVDSSKFVENPSLWEI